MSDSERLHDDMAYTLPDLPDAEQMLKAMARLRERRLVEEMKLKALVLARQSYRPKPYFVTRSGLKACRVKSLGEPVSLPFVAFQHGSVK